MAEENRETGRPPTPSLALPLGLLVLVLTMWCAWLLFGATTAYGFLDAKMHAAAGATAAASAASAPQLAELGQLGDLFGGLNALFAAVTVAGVVWAGSLQRAALVETRQALVEERRASQRQVALAMRQQHEAMLSQLMLQLDAATDRIGAEEAAVDAQSPRGLACIEHTAARLAQQLRFGAAGGDGTAKGQRIGAAFQAVTTGKGSSNLLPYLRLLRFVLSFISRAPQEHFNASTKRHYADLVAIHLTEPAAFVYALFEVCGGSQERLALVEQFSLLEAGDSGLIAEFRPLLESQFAPMAFGANR